MNEEKTPPGSKVLIVDDDKTVSQVLRRYLEYWDLEVRTAGDGFEALNLFESEQFDVVLTDLMMPGMDGIELTEKILESYPKVKVILITGYASVNTAVEAFKKGVFDYVIKPFQNMESIYQTIFRAIEYKNLIHEKDELYENLKRANIELETNRKLLHSRIDEIDTELARRIIRMEILYEISRSISSVTNKKEILKTIMDKTSSIMGDAAGILWLSTNTEMNKETTVRIPENIYIPAAIPKDSGLLVDTSKSDRINVYEHEEVLSDTLCRKICEVMGIKRLLVIPLRYENRILGLINLIITNDYKVTEEDIGLLESIADQAAISIRNTELFDGQKLLFRETIEALATAIDSRDHYTRGHSYMVTELAMEMGRQLGFDSERLEFIRTAGILHDVGKIGISDSILNKPGQLTEQERGAIEDHLVLGRMILESVEALKPVAHIIYHHHERWDGKGYPEGLKGEDIPLESRILQIADIFHALISDRIYRKAIPVEEAVDILKDGLGTIIDPQLGELFLNTLEQGKFDKLLDLQVK